MFLLVATLLLALKTSAIPDAYLRVPQIAAKYGYPLEVHYVTTPDGYILTLHRIPHGRLTTHSSIPVLLYHGLLCDSSNFVTSGNRSLGFVLADAGYDVWLGNARGNRESRNHTTLNPDSDSKFWDFSWHEIGTIDLPTVIDHILGVTAVPSLHYIGYSQGGTILFVLLTTRPEYNTKIRVHLNLAPGSWMNGTRIPLFKAASSHVNLIEHSLKSVGVHEVFPYNHHLMATIQKVYRLSPRLFTDVFLLFCGYSDGQRDSNITESMIGHLPDGASTRQMVHFMQLAQSGYFRRYDFGRDNVKVYGSEEPPSYDLPLVTAPGFVFYSRNDKMVVAEDVERLCRKMVNGCIERFLVKNFNHLDYLYGKKAPELYEKMLRVMERY